MKTIKKISGDLLLYFYNRKRLKGYESDISLRFEYNDYEDRKVKFNPTNDLEKDLLSIADNDSANLFNALQYLNESGFLYYDDSIDGGGNLFYKFHVTSYGVDIIEGIEQNDKARNDFNVNFNFKLADEINVESLIKNELGSLVKLGLM